MNPIVESALLATRTESSASYGYNSKNIDKPFFSHCGLKGHTIDKCYRVHGLPPGHRNKGRGSQPHQAAAAMVPNQSATGVPGQAFSDIPKFALSQALPQCQELMKHVAMLSSQFSEMETNSIDSRSSQALAPSAGPQIAHVVTQSTDSYPQASTFAAFDPQASILQPCITWQLTLLTL